jgi:hypothetical protein
VLLSDYVAHLEGSLPERAYGAGRCQFDGHGRPAPLDGKVPVLRKNVAAGKLSAVIVVLSCVGCANPAIANNAAQTRVQSVQRVPRAQRKPAKAKASKRTTPEAQAAKPLTVESAYKELSAAVAEPIRDDGGNAAVAVDDLTSGVSVAYNSTKEFVTASVVKVDILSALLYQLQQAGRAVSVAEQEMATTMIENSDNDAASDLYYDVDGSAGIDAANRAFGLIETTAGTDGYWGLTTTTVDDQIRLLNQVFTSSSVLSSASRSFIQGLMSNVESDQRWGVSAAADGGTEPLVKNGWLPNPSLWEINSIGEVTHDRQRMLIAVLSDDNASEDSGISVVESLAEKAADAIAADER